MVETLKPGWVRRNDLLCPVTLGGWEPLLYENERTVVSLLRRHLLFPELEYWCNPNIENVSVRRLHLMFYRRDNGFPIEEIDGD